jgi:hypothetical protein
LKVRQNGKIANHPDELCRDSCIAARGIVSFWRHKYEVQRRFQGRVGRHLLSLGFSQFDPQRILVLACRFMCEDGSPIQGVR